jgi:uncharacterized protein YecT (DUF1311 family)
MSTSATHYWKNMNRNERMKMKKLLAIMTFSLIASTAIAQVADSFKQAITQYGAEHGGNLASAPKVKPDGKFYYLNGKIQIPDKKNAGFLANLSPSEENELLANALRRSRGIGESTDYFGVVLPKSLEDYYFNNAKVGSGFDVIGRYVANTEYSTVDGREKQAPVFEAVYFDLWAKRHAVSATPAKTSPVVANASAPQANRTSNSYEKCIDDAAGIMPDMIDCSDAEAKRQDARLNAAYKVAMSKVANKDDLKSKQRAWIKARDKACQIDNDGGQAAQLSFNECIGKETAQRANELESIR